MDTQFGLDLSGATDVTLNRLAVASVENRDLKLGRDSYLRDALALARFSAKFVEKAVQDKVGFGSSRQFAARVRELQERADFALENSDSLVSDICARAVLDALVRERQEQLHNQRCLLPHELSNVIGNAPISKVNYRILTASRLTELLRVGTQQNMSIIKLAVFGRRSVLESSFSQFLGQDIRLSDEGTEASPSIILLRASVSRQLLIYTVGIPSDCAQNWPVDSWLQGFSAAVHCARDLSSISNSEGQMLYTCLTQITKEKVVVTLPGAAGTEKNGVDKILREWISINDLQSSGENLQELLRRAIFPNG
ncbi:MAG: hypothetical protein AABY83_08860 [Pseudomonadota bacterium]